MKMPCREDFLEKSTETLSEIHKWLDSLENLDIKELDSRKTGLIMIDMTNGFAREGALKSERVEALIPEIMKLSSLCDSYKVKKVALTDYHKPDSREFDSYPPHCIEDTMECEVVEEIKGLGGYELIRKNSTNGFLESGFEKWMKANKEIDCFILTGDCTDICILQLATSLKAWFNQKEKASRIIVPISGVDTYELGIHNGDLMNVMSLYNMMINGVEIVKGIK